MKRYLLLQILLLTVWAVQADTLTLSLGQYLSAYPQTADGHWTEVYSDNAQVEAGLFRFSHTGTPDEGMGMAYWDGFAVCTSGDNADYGSEGSSDGWIDHQWGCMAGGGLDDNAKTKAGNPYMVAYWGYYQESLDEDYHSLRVDFTDGKQHKAVGVYICNHPWPYYGNENGDGFASAFQNEGDYFGVVVHGLNSAGEDIGITVKHELASYRNGQLQQSTDWEYVDLTALGSVSAIYFTMETTDMDALYGANTAVFFCLDRLSVEVVNQSSNDDDKQDENKDDNNKDDENKDDENKDDENKDDENKDDNTEPYTLDRPTGLKIVAIAEDSAVLSWRKTPNAESYKLYLNQEQKDIVTDTFYVFRSLQVNTEYQLAVRACAQKAEDSDLAAMTVTTPDLTAPTAPHDLRAEADFTSVRFSWTAATDNVAVERYTVFLNGEAYRHTAQTEHLLTGLEPATDYLLEVQAEDKAGNKSEKASLQVRTKEETAIEDIFAEDMPFEVYSADGKYLGTTMPQAKGIYIVRQQNKTYKIQIN